MRVHVFGVCVGGGGGVKSVCVPYLKPGGTRQPSNSEIYLYMVSEIL